MSGPIRDLTTLLARTTATLHPRMVAVLALDGFERPSALSDNDVIGCFRETEGLTLYADAAAVEAANLPITMRAAWITLDIESALDAVGFTAAFSTALTEAGVACNVIAGARHDHILVPWEQRETAMRTLSGLARNNPG